MKFNDKSTGLLSVFLAGVVTLSGCGGEKQTVSNIPMITEAVGVGPWQLVTYHDERVMKETVHIDDGRFATRTEPVYINNKSQVIFRNGERIRDFDGGFLYWNDNGNFINMDLHVISESLVFSANGKPLPVGTALKLRGYAQPVDLAAIKHRADSANQL